MQWLRQNTDQSLNTQKTLRVSYGVYFMSIWKEIGHVITAPQYIHHMFN